jgi:hypothetical protein
MVDATNEMARDSLAWSRVKIIISPKASRGKMTMSRHPVRIGSDQTMINP